MPPQRLSTAAPVSPILKQPQFSPLKVGSSGGDLCRRERLSTRSRQPGERVRERLPGAAALGALGLLSDIREARLTDQSRAARRRGEILQGVRLI